MASKILTISKHAGDANVGQTLVRMAQLAAAAHLHAVVAREGQSDAQQPLAAAGRVARQRRTGAEGER
jgi:hypothetical protein